MSHLKENLFVKFILSFFFAISLFFTLNSVASAATYYISVADGDDTNCTGLASTAYTSGSGQPCPWKTIAKVNATSFAAGDSILFKVGETWREQLNIPSSGSAGNLITYSSYGTGDKPKIYGSLVPSSWTQEDYSIPPTLTKLQGGGTASPSAVAAKTFTDTPVSGNLMVAVGWGTTADSNATITGWTKAVAVQTATAGYLAIFYKVAGAAESKTVTLNWTSSTQTNLAIEEWSGLVSPVLDKTASTANTGGVTSKSTGTTETTTATYEVLIAAFGHGDTVSDRTYTNSFTEDYDVGAGNKWQIASKTTTATGAQETTQSWTTTRVAGAAIATFGGTESARSLYYTSMAADPGYIWFIDTGGTVHTGNKVASKDLLLTDYDWWYDTGNTRLYINSATDPLTRYNSVEVTNTAIVRGIWWGGVTEHKYIKIDGFDIAFITGVGIVVRGNSEVINNHVHHLGLETGNHSYGIEINAGSDCLIAHNTVNNTLTSGIYVVASYDPETSSNNIIEYNTVYDSKNELIRLRTEPSHTVELSGNIIRYNNLYHTSGFTDYGYGYGISFTGMSGVPADSFQVYYNKIFTEKVAIRMEDYVTNAEIYNNSIISRTGMGIYVSGTGTSGIIIKNNLVALAGLYGLRVVDKTKVSACDNNLWYAPAGTGYAYIDSTNYTSTGFAAYKSATGWDTNGLWEDPLITSTATPDFYLQSTSPAIGAGANVGLTTDYAGTSVPQDTTYDIGAYEFIPDTVVSITISDGTLAYGTMAVNTSKTSIDLTDTQTLTNAGNVTEVFTIKGQDTACPWTLSASAGTDAYVHAFCKKTDVSCASPPTNYTALTTTYQTLYTGVAASGTRDLDLRITVPTTSTCSSQQSADITILAAQE